MTPDERVTEARQLLEALGMDAECFEVGPHTVGVTVAHLPCKVSYYFRAVGPIPFGVTKAGRTLVAEWARAALVAVAGVAVVGADTEGFVASTAVGGTHDSTPSAQSAPST